MSRKITWTSIASILLNFIDDFGNCKLCGEKVLTFRENNFEKLRKVYQHFTKKHQITFLKLTTKVVKVKI